MVASYYGAILLECIKTFKEKKFQLPSVTHEYMNLFSLFTYNYIIMLRNVENKTKVGFCDYCYYYYSYLVNQNYIKIRLQYISTVLI